MHHLIIVKWKEDTNIDENMINDINNLFQQTLNLDGIQEVNIRKNIIDRNNRYDLMIDITMNQDSLPLYDKSVFHHEWKDKYSKYILSKVIFDY